MTSAVSGSTDQEPDSGYPRLDQQIRWYDQKSASAQWWYKHIKWTTFCVGILVPAMANIDGRVTAALGAIVVALESLQQLNQWQQNWHNYRATCEALRHEKYLYLVRAGSYDGLDDQQAVRRLAEKVEALVSTEHAQWLERQESKRDGKIAPKGAAG